MENLKILLLFYYINDSVCYIKQLFLKYFRKKEQKSTKTNIFFNFKENLLCYDIKEKLFFLKNYCYVKVMQHNG